MDMKRPRKLNFNAPLLSTRRLGNSTAAEMPCTSSQGATQDTSNGIPFSWEQAPGKPKDMATSDLHEGDTPRPRLPPSWWHDHDDDGCDGDVDDDEDEHDVFSDAIDVFSLTEAIDIVEKAEKVAGLDKLNLASVECSGNQSPDFIIKRFLPAANALAASSALAASRNLNKKLSNSCNYPEAGGLQAVGQSYASPKSCGLEIFFPWRTKHKFCGIKNPVRQGSPSVQPQCSPKQKTVCSLTD